MGSIARGQRSSIIPGRVDIEGSFDCFPLLGGSIGGEAYMSGATEGCPNFDTVIEATNLGEGSLTDSKKITVTLVDDAVYADAVFNAALDSGRAVAPAHMDTIFALGGVTPLGDAGNAWELCFVGDMPAAAGEQVYDDAVAGITYIRFEPGVSTAVLIEAAVGGYGGEVIIDTVDTIGGFLTVADDEFAPQLFHDGADQETVSVIHMGETSDVTVHFEAAASTVAEAEAVITALTGDDAIIAVQTAGTGASVLQAGDVLDRTFLHSGQCSNIHGRDFSATRVAVGTYDVTFAATYPGGLRSFDSCLQVPAVVAAYTVDGVITPVSRTARIYVCDHATGNAVDPANDTKIHFTARMDNLG